MAASHSAITPSRAEVLLLKDTSTTGAKRTQDIRVHTALNLTQHTNQEPRVMYYTYTRAPCLCTQRRTQHAHTHTENLSCAHTLQIQITPTRIPKTQHRHTPLRTQRYTHLSDPAWTYTHPWVPTVGAHTLQNPAQQQTPQNWSCICILQNLQWAQTQDPTQVKTPLGTKFKCSYASYTTTQAHTQHNNPIQIHTPQTQHGSRPLWIRPVHNS